MKKRMAGRKKSRYRAGRHRWGIRMVCVVCLVSALAWIRIWQEDDRQVKKAQSSVKAADDTLLSDAVVPLTSIRDIDAGTLIQQESLNLEQISMYFTVQDIDEDIFQYINGKSYTENSNIGLQDLRYLKVLHYNYDHEIQVGELIVNEKIAEDCRNIFQELFAVEYEIQSMYLLDRFWVGNGVDSDTASIESNNTSAFNYRVVPGTDHLSNHARGCAIDLNPLQNPYVKYKKDGTFDNYYKDMEKYIDRSCGEAHMITHEDPAYQIFTKYGFTWGGDWNSSKDYQHFEKK